MSEAVFAALAGERVRMIDATVVRAHQHATGAKRAGRLGAGPLARGLLDQAALALRRKALPLAIVLTPGQDARDTGLLVEGMAPGTRCLIGDTGYDADWVRQDLLLCGVLPVCQ